MSAGSFESQKPKRALDLCTFITTIVLASFFGKYAFRNPDKTLCFADGSDNAYFGGGPMMTDVTYRFKVWFEWGFIFNCVAFLQICMVFVESIASDRRVKEAINKVAGVSRGILGLASLVHTILGAIFRWSHSGKVCSGDYLADEIVDSFGHIPPYQFKSGQFMRVYLILLLVMWGLAACCGGAVAFCAITTSV